MANETTLIQEIKNYISEGDASTKSADEHYREAGKRLLELRKLHDKTKANGKKLPPWATYVRENCGIEKSRAYDLMKLANDKSGVTARKMHSKRAVIMRKVRAKKRPSPDGQNDTDTDTDTDTDNVTDKVVLLPSNKMTAAEKREFWDRSFEACNDDPRIRDSNEGAQVARRRGFLYCADEARKYAQAAHNPLVGDLNIISLDELDDEIIKAGDAVISEWRDTMNKIKAKRRNKGGVNGRKKNEKDRENEALST